MYNDIEDANIDNLNDYLEAFYEDKIADKIRSARRILLLILDYRNLEELLSHDSFMGTLTRTLQDEYKKNMELCIYLLSSFYILSNYENFHEILMQNKTGDTTIKIIEYQIQRFDLRMAEYQEKEREIESMKKGSPQQMEARARQEKELKTFNKMIARQDKVFYISFNILLNLADDFKIERKMIKRNIISCLVRMLERNNADLLVTTLYFLKKLSIIGENKDQMVQEGIIERMPRFFKQSNEPLMHLALRLLINLSFDKKARGCIEARGMIKLIVDLLNMNQLRLLVLIELYLISSDDRMRNALAQTDCPYLIYKLIIHFPEPIVGRELMALGVNLAANKACANMLSEADQLDNLLQRAFKYGDILLFKMIRNISQFSDLPETVDNFKVYSLEILKLAMSKNINDDLRIELIGILSNVQLGKEWLEHLKNGVFLEFITQNISVGVAEDDIMLEVICLIGTICENDNCVEFIGKKQDDDEFIYQILYIVYRLLLCDKGTETILGNNKFIDYCIEAIGDKNPKIRKMVDDVNSLVMEYDLVLAEKIKTRKFCTYNQEWVDSMNQFERTVNWNQYEGQYGWEEDEDEGNGLDPKMWESDSDVE